jgi:hypothetical protein
LLGERAHVGGEPNCCRSARYRCRGQHGATGERMTTIRPASKPKQPEGEEGEDCSRRLSGQRRVGVETGEQKRGPNTIASRRSGREARRGKDAAGGQEGGVEGRKTCSRPAREQRRIFVGRAKRPGARPHWAGGPSRTRRQRNCDYTDLSPRNLFWYPPRGGREWSLHRDGSCALSTGPERE